MSCELMQGLQRAAETRQWASAPGMSLGGSKCSSLAAGGRPSGVESEGEGPTAKFLKSLVQFER